jgi:mono/diheme cytochrome c family protein
VRELAGRSPGWTLISIGLAFSLGFCGCHGTPALTDEQVEGKHYYQVRCAHCHEDNDLALKKIPPALDGLFRHRNLPSGAPATDAEVRRVVLAGKGAMPSFSGRFSEEQLSALVAYLHAGVR